MSASKSFFDIHCHLMNLSHPSLVAFFQNWFQSSTSSVIKEVLALSDFLPGHGVGTTSRHVMNLLTVMENDIGPMLLILEDDLAGRFRKDKEQPFIRHSKLHIAGCEYDKLVLTPLIMDFTSRKIESENLYYKATPDKPLRKQIRDMLDGIRHYVTHRPDGLLEIYPFLGINPMQHELEDIKKLLHEFLGFYSISRQVFYKTLVALRQVDVANISGRGLFAGVKLYPPLGFDPWPEGDPDALVKVNYVYEFCQKRGIPITTHCDDQGFRTIPLQESLEYTSPERWRKVLHYYPDLKLNFAHFGRQYQKKFGVLREMGWMHEIIELCIEYPNVYTDFSYTGVRPEFYEFLSQTLREMSVKRRIALERKILFGSDFMINLLEIPSYFDYYKRFVSSPLTDSQKALFGSENPSRFLFEK